MKSKIERISSEEDFIGVHNLYEGRKSIQELKWLYTDPNSSEYYNAFVAKTETNQVIGVIGYQTSIFKQGQTRLKGVIDFTWKVSPGIKGLHGLMLKKKIFEFGDFLYGMGGSKDAQKLSQMFKYKAVTRYCRYYKILNLKQYKGSLEKEGFKMKVGKLAYLIPSIFLRSPKGMISNDVRFSNYKSGSIPFEESEITIKNNISNNHVDWLLQCPLVESFAFNINKGSNYLGTCVCYIGIVNYIKIGRIVYLPFLGNDVEIWVNVIENCLKIFKENNCAFVSAVGSHKMNKAGLKKAGFIGNIMDKKLVTVSDKMNVTENFDFNLMQMQFSDGGDLHYLGLVD